MAAKITMSQWQIMHPLKFKSHTDAYYLKRSNLLLDQIRLSPLGKGLYLQAQQDMAITIYK